MRERSRDALHPTLYFPSSSLCVSFVINHSFLALYHHHCHPKAFRTYQSINDRSTDSYPHWKMHSHFWASKINFGKIINQIESGLNIYWAQYYWVGINLLFLICQMKINNCLVILHTLKGKEHYIFRKLLRKVLDWSLSPICTLRVA